MRAINERSFRVRALAIAVGTTLSLIQVANAQQNSSIEEIAITGTRIRTTTDGMVTPTPVTAVSTAEMRNFDPGTSISEQLDTLPQFLNTQTAQRGGGTLFGDAAGSYLNLRNMGKQRTLVLVDGSRTVPADRAGTVNVDNFPTALVRSVDVVTGGASAAYGADAMSGVVNFVLDREYTGMKTSVSTGITGRGDGDNYNFSVAGGTKIGDKTHVIGSVEHRVIHQIERNPQDLDNWNSIGWVVNPAYKATDPRGTNPRLLTVPHAYHLTQNPQGIITTPAGTAASVTSQFKYQGWTFTDDGKNVRPFDKGDFPASSNGMTAGNNSEAAYHEKAFNGGPFGAEVVQHSGFGGVKYDLSPSTELFGQVILGRTESNTYNRRGNPEMGQQYFATVYRENAYLPAEVGAEMDRLGLTSLRFDKIGQVRTGTNKNFYDNRSDANISQMWSTSMGFDHRFGNDWTLKGTYQYGDSTLTSEAKNIIRVDHWYLSLDSVRDPATGKIVCNIQKVNPTNAQLQAAAAGQSVLTTRIQEFPNGLMPINNILVTPDESIKGCVPSNFFGLGNSSPEADDYMTSDKKGYRDLSQHFAELLLSGDLYKGWGAGSINFAAGLTYRKEDFNQITEPVDFERSTINAPQVGVRGISAGITGGNRSIHQFSATSWANGDFNVWEAFGELNVPIWQSSGGDHRLDTNFAYRRSDYSSSGTINSWKYGFELQTFKDLRFRVTQSRDVREPTFQEQYESGGGGANVTDPKFTTANFYTVTILTLGNSTLSPEIADTLTAGFVWRPSMKYLDGLQFSADYYNIDVAKRITPLGAQRLIDECSSGVSPLFCNQIFRNAGTGRIERVDDKQVNAAAGVTSGVDFELRYDLETNFFSSQKENLRLRLFASHLLENSVTTTVYRDDAGSLTSPRWNATATLSYDVGNFGINWVTRFYDATTYTNGFGVFWVSGADVDDATIQSQVVHNLGLSYKGQTKGGSDWIASFNVSNIFDRDPPVVASQNLRGGQQGVSNVFDVFGRRFQVGLNYTF